MLNEVKFAFGGKKLIAAGTASALILGAIAVQAFASHSPLVARFHLNEDATDSSGHGNDGTISGAEFVRGRFGRALEFDGAGDYVEINHADSLDVTSPYTIEAWVYANDELVNKYRPIVFRGAVNANDIEVYIQANSKDLIVAHNRGNGGNFDYVGFQDPPLGQWFHLAITFDGTYVQAYYTGSLATVVQQNTAVNSPLDTNNGWWIGKVHHTAFGTLPGGTPDNYFKGKLDEVRVWSCELTAEEIAQHAKSNSSAAPSCQGN